MSTRASRGTGERPGDLSHQFAWQCLQQSERAGDSGAASGSLQGGRRRRAVSGGGDALG